MTRSAGRSRPALRHAGHVVGTLALAVALAAAAFRLDAPSASGSQVEPDGRALYLTGCANCHGEDGRGTDAGPSLEEAGTAAAFYYLETGRMPMTETEGQPRRKPPAYEPAERDALVAYVGTLGDGPDLEGVRVDPEDGDVAEGGSLYRANCAPCHAAAGIGGALNRGRLAPSIGDAEPEVVAAAVRVGPGQMPVFPPEALDDVSLAAVIAYTQHLRDPTDRGGASLGGAGPIPEGAVAWVFGFGAIAAATWWLGSRERAT